MTSKKKKSTGIYEVIKFPKNRKMVIDIMEQGIKKHYIKGLVEFDAVSYTHLTLPTILLV